jgi:alkylation response protein AidB-like acyl-CoA dehydrogenase
MLVGTATHPSFGRCRYPGRMASQMSTLRTGTCCEAVFGFLESSTDMNLGLTDDQRMIRDEAGRLLAERSSPEAVRRIVEAGEGTDAALWKTLAAELGWCSMAIPEEHGGLGLGPTELSLLLEACGRRLACAPFWSTVCQSVPLILAAATDEAQARLLPTIASGEAAATVAWGAIGAADPLAATTVSATLTEGGYVLQGSVAQVVDLQVADLVLLPARIGGSIGLFALDRNSGFEDRSLRTLDATRPIGELVLDGVRVPAIARIERAALTSRMLAPALALANLGLAAEQLGAARGVMDITLAYVAERVQFGRTLASFQAIKHRCAKLEVDLAEARALVYGAAAGFSPDRTEDVKLEVSAARALASDVLFRAAEEAIQMHGGVGFTWEYDPHLYFKRAQASFSLLAPPETHLERIADAIIGEAAA